MGICIGTGADFRKDTTMTEENDNTVFGSIDRRTALKGALGTAGAAAIYSSFGTRSAAAQAASLEAELEGPLQSVDVANNTITVMGITVNVPESAVLTTATTTLTSLEDAVGATLPGRTEPGFIGGTAIVVGTTDGTTVTANEVFFDVAENVIVGTLTENTLTGPTLSSGGEFRVQGVSIQSVGDPRQPLDAGVAGLEVDLSTVPVGSLVAVEGYFVGTTEPTLYVHTVEAEQGELLDPTAVSITRIECADEGRLEIRGGNFEAGTITVFNADTGEQLGTTEAVVDPETGVATYVFRTDVETCPMTVRVENAAGSTVTADVATGAPVTDEPEEPPAAGDTSTLTVQGSGSLADYAFTVSETILSGSGLSGEDAITGPTASGAVRGGQDSYTFTGEITNFTLNGNATVLVDGEPFAVTPTESSLLEIQGLGSRADYSFAVSGTLSRTNTLTREDEITGSSATGAVRAGQDSYFYSGEITDFNLTGEATVSIDGTEVDPATL